jgi:uncharacterized protein YjbI with pentapeptide repeats
MSLTKSANSRFAPSTETRQFMSVQTPYTFGDYAGNNPASPLSAARYNDKADEGRRGLMGAFGLLGALGLPLQETRAHPLNGPNPIQLSDAGAKGYVSRAGGLTAGLYANKDAAARLKSVQESRLDAIGPRLADEYDSSRIQAILAAGDDYWRNKAAVASQTAGQNTNLPVQKILAKDGTVLLQGHARSKEELIANAVKEAETSSDPRKKVVNLNGADLTGLNFKDMALTNISMRGANIKGTTFENCKLENVDMAEIQADHTTKISKSLLRNVDMSGADAPGIQLEHIRGEFVNMAGANMAGARWSDVKIENLWAAEINLNNAQLGTVTITGPYSSFKDAQMHGAKVSMSQFGDVNRGIDMSGIKATHSTWSDVKFHQSDMSGSDFSSGTFTRVDMSRVYTKPGYPMTFDKANITGLTVGRGAELTADKAIKDGITLRPVENFVFRGTEPLDRAVDAAIVAGAAEASIKNAHGDTDLEQVQRAQLVQPQHLQQQRPKPNLLMQPAAPSPFSNGKRKSH